MDPDFFDNERLFDIEPKDRDRGDRDDRDRGERDLGDRDDRDKSPRKDRERRDASVDSGDAEKDRRSKRRRTERGERSERTESSKSSKRPRDDDDVLSRDSADGNGLNNERRILIPSIVLLSKSGYFKNMLISQFKESKEKEIVIRVPPKEMQATYEVIKCAYMDSIPQDVKATQLIELLFVAHKFDFRNVVQMVTKRLGNIYWDDCLDLKEIMLLLELPEGIREAKWFKGVMKRVSDHLVNTFLHLDCIFCNGEKNVADEFLDLPVSALKILLYRGGFINIQENDIWVAVCLWGRHNGGRSLDELAPYIRFSDMWPSFLENEVRTSKEYEYSVVIRNAVVNATVFTARRTPEEYCLEQVVFDYADVKGVFEKTKNSTKLENVYMLGYVWVISMVRDGEQLMLCLSNSSGAPVNATFKFSINDWTTEWTSALFARNVIQINFMSEVLVPFNNSKSVRLMIKHKEPIGYVPRK